MRILYHHRTASRDGQAVHIEEIIHALGADGHEVILVAPAAGGDAMGSENPIIARLKRVLPGAVYELLELGYSLPAFWKLWRACRRHRPDALYERYNSFLLSGLWLARLTGLPLLCEVNAPLTEERLAHGGLALPGLARLCDRLIWRGADRVLPVTDVLADYLRRAGVAEERIEVIANGVDTARFRPDDPGSAVRGRYRLGEYTVLGFTGFFRPWHGLDLVVRQIRAMPDARLLIVGDGEDRAGLEALARDLDVADRLTITGFVSREEVPDHVAAFDIALQPAVTDYASPLKLFEYMASGCAVVAPDQRNIREVLRHEQNALLFTPGDLEAFGAAVARLLADGTLRRRLGEAAAATIAGEGRTWADNARRIVRLFEEIRRA